MSDLLHDEAIARSLVDRLRTVFDLRRVVWFGSRAQGTGEPDSDWDLLVVAPSSESATQRAARALRATADTRVDCDFVVLTPQEYARLRAWRSSIAHQAEATGRVLLAAP
ncbi:MAG: nucleotidyltransferase domain-containing protein [Deltaproteobacteria bacterium]|nr:nucleotidyltransferase domain-containing protein [Deltaproteobacteria bacterium]